MYKYEQIGNQFKAIPLEGAELQAELDRISAPAKAEALAYLASTDWYYARKAETGEEVPADVVQKRLEARALLNT